MNFFKMIYFSLNKDFMHVLIAGANKRMIVLRGFIFSVCLALCACASQPEWTYRDKEKSIREQVDFPMLDSLVAVSLGETLASKGYKSTTPAIKILEDFTFHEADLVTPRHWIAADSQGRMDRVGTSKDDERVDCYTVHYNFDAHLNWGNKVGRDLPIGLCESAQVLVIQPGYRFGGEMPLDVPVDKFNSVSLESPAHIEEFIYNGRVGDALKFVYREFSGDYLKPAFTQEVQYDLGSSNIIGFKDLKIEVIEASNVKIRYKLISNF